MIMTIGKGWSAILIMSRVVHEQSICAIIAEKRLTFTIAQFLLKRIDRVNTP